MFAARCLLLALLHVPDAVLAQAGPPFLTNDPGTPGNANWEINLGSMQTISRGASSYQVPQIDLNFGVGERIQLTYEIPYIVQDSAGQPARTGWGNAFPGVKWRFLDHGEDGLQMAIFPQVQVNGSEHAREAGIAVAGPRTLLPVETSGKLGPLSLDRGLRRRSSGDGGTGAGRRTL